MSKYKIELNHIINTPKIEISPFTTIGHTRDELDRGRKLGDDMMNDIKQALKLKELVENEIKVSLHAESMVACHNGHECMNLFLVERLKELLEESKK